MKYDLERFVAAQEKTYDTALAEIKSGRKQSHWMWFIYPQIEGLGSSTTAQFYAIADLEEARQYLAHPLLGKRLIEISTALLELDKSANAIFGTPDDLKLQSSMTLFREAGENSVFQNVLDHYFQGEPDEQTLVLLGKD